MAINIKSEREIKLMRESGRILANVLKELETYVKPGISTLEIDKKCYEIIKSYGCIPSFLDYRGFPASLCISVNDEVVHGIPDDYILREGDIVSLDCGVIYEGYHSDAARTIPVGEITKEAKKLIEVAEQSFYEGIKYAKEGKHLHEISEAIQTYVESFGFSVVRDLVGHGIGRDLHEEPNIPNFKQRNRGPRLREGMTLAIEPMINAGRYDVYCLDNDWTIVTEDGSLSAHYENTVLITKDQAEILTII
ncbi:MAG: type I methionyl aminopeptidase [Clostridiales bacterium]|jgi:methionyl aminopeptidase|nr:type I methionyl aminopeptidase [Clostridiales bacterium]